MQAAEIELVCTNGMVISKISSTSMSAIYISTDWTWNFCKMEISAPSLWSFSIIQAWVPVYVSRESVKKYWRLS